MAKVFTRATIRMLALAAGIVCLATPVSAREKIVFQSMVPTLEPLPARKVLSGSVIQTEVKAPPATNMFGYADKGSTFPTTVNYVTPNSVAWLGGMQAGDHIINGRFKGERAILIIERQGHKYSCILNANAMSTGDIRGGTIASGGGGKTTATKAEKSDAQTLASYSIAMVVDNSASMATKDCPGEISRWQWCKDHIGELSLEERGALQNNISIVTFDTNFHSRQNCSASELQSIFAANSPSGETNMAPALDEAFALVRRQLDNGKPAIVTVISDGRPSDVENVKKSIIRETNALSKAKLLSIVFIEVGTPEHYLQELDNDLVKQGAAADIVKVIPFSAASSQGLSKTLVSTIPKAPAPTSSTVLSGAASANGPNRARAAVASHVFTYDPSQPPPAAQPKAHPATVSQISAHPPVAPAPPVKAHPSGTPAADAAAAARVQEVDEKSSVLRNSANRTYK